VKLRIINALLFTAGYLSIGLAALLIGGIFIPPYPESLGDILTKIFLSSVIAVLLAWIGTITINRSSAPGLIARISLRRGELIEVAHGYSSDDYPTAVRFRRAPFDNTSRFEIVRFKKRQNIIRPGYRYYFDGTNLQSALPEK
jgi:hypothetical protein